jgi:hypothetical protein
MSSTPNLNYNADNDFYYLLATMDDEAVKTTLLHFNLTEIINMSNQIKKINFDELEKEEIVEFLLNTFHAKVAIEPAIILKAGQRFQITDSNVNTEKKNFVNTLLKNLKMRTPNFYKSNIRNLKKKKELNGEDKRKLDLNENANKLIKENRKEIIVLMKALYTFKRFSALSF